MGCLQNCYKFITVFGFCLSWVTSNYTTDYGVKDSLVEENEMTGSIPMLSTQDMHNQSIVLKMATLCETPNHDSGYCIEIKQCTLLLNQLNNSKSWSFLRASRCGPTNEDHSNPKVCCGKYKNFRNASKNIVDENNIFPKTCGVQESDISDRIYGGDQASLGDYPWMARLIHKNKFGHTRFGCSGFLVHAKYVITAAHCTHPNVTKVTLGPVYSVVLGEHNTETNIDCDPFVCADPLQISRAAKVIVHPEYNPDAPEHYNDISIIHLNKGIRFSSYVQPICLPMDPAKIPTRYFLSGWGRTETEQTSKIKMNVEIPPYDRAECLEIYSNWNIKLLDSQICAGGQGKKDSCTGDSGGPLMTVSNNGTWFAAGIVSYGAGCGLRGSPGVYTDISSFIPWIKTQIIQNSIVAKKDKLRSRHKSTEGST